MKPKEDVKRKEKNSSLVVFRKPSKFINEQTKNIREIFVLSK